LSNIEQNWNDMQVGELQFWEATLREKNKDNYTDHWLKKLSIIYTIPSIHEIVLDIGSGPIPVSPYSKDMLSVDPLAHKYRKAGYDKRFDSVASVGESLPFKDNSIDIIYCVNTLDHSNNPELFIKEMHRILKLNGKLKYQVDIRNKPDPLHKVINRYLLSEWLDIFKSVTMIYDKDFSATECGGIIGECTK